MHAIQKHWFICFLKAITAKMNQIIKFLNPNIATGIDGIPLKVIKFAKNKIGSHLEWGSGRT